jgi:hypothetical protein
MQPPSVTVHPMPATDMCKVIRERDLRNPMGRNMGYRIRYHKYIQNGRKLAMDDMDVNKRRVYVHSSISNMFTVLQTLYISVSVYIPRLTSKGISSISTHLPHPYVHVCSILFHHVTIISPTKSIYTLIYIESPSSVIVCPLCLTPISVTPSNPNL